MSSDQAGRMREFQSHDGECFYIKSRGWWGYPVVTPFPDDLWEPDQLSGETVLLDGHEVTVLAVEAFAVFRSPESPYRRLGYSFMLRERLPDQEAVSNGGGTKVDDNDGYEPSGLDEFRRRRDVSPAAARRSFTP